MKSKKKKEDLLLKEYLTEEEIELLKVIKKPNYI
jgi:hypothetical protein